jgi:S1-C subfamily serine protease
MVWSTGTVDAVPTAVPSGGAKGKAGIAVTASTADRTPGAPLLDPGGAVLGILDGAIGGTSGTHVFLPEQLVLGVADQLVATGTVRHGWLDVSGRSAATTVASHHVVAGAVVGAVDPQGAAAGVLRSGDVIVGVSGAPVRNMAELRTRLYVLPPGASVTLDVWRGTELLTVPVELAGTP